MLKRDSPHKKKKKLMSAFPESGRSTTLENAEMTVRFRPQAVELRIDDAPARGAPVILYTGPEIPQGVFATWLESRGA